LGGIKKRDQYGIESGCDHKETSGARTKRWWEIKKRKKLTPQPKRKTGVNRKKPPWELGNGYELGKN